ncbi:phage baseplate assembly protein W [Azospirillum fermentarium]|uniref:GPW/gp25 family protein n=1 Tax=Azospirillum fermentarium TaxID=1233114 RepID=UPI002225E3BE|nr:GPW/gp25 family protein [Azospirillum fermentarium]MCW2248687.1 phage baseplate assembly protein W [Azospirillum fermentarium]
MGISLQAVDWSLALGRWGEVAEGIEDVSQCVAVILKTPLRSDPHRPDFGCDLQPWIDMPVSTAAPGMAAAVRMALERWEPRLTILDVAVSPAGGAAQKASSLPDAGKAGFFITVRWQLAGSIAVPGTTTVNIGEILS